MIIVRLMGGLGNQMFQYAAGKRLATHHDTELKLDLSFLESKQENCTPRKFQLKDLNIDACIARPRDMVDITGNCEDKFTKYLYKIRKITGLRRCKPNILRERHFHFDETVLNAPDYTFLEGYWQSEKYFSDVSDLIRKEFTVKSPLYGENLLFAELIQACNSVSIHIRRGDYVSNEATKRAHGVCSMDYYLKCVDIMGEKVPDPHFFIFSDEPEWAREHFSIPFSTTYISGNGTDKGHEDLRLMSLCRHNIIANSSLSWWGAWLNSNSAKTVFAPQKWFDEFDANTEDLMPQSWIRI